MNSRRRWPTNSPWAQARWVAPKHALLWGLVLGILWGIPPWKHVAQAAEADPEVAGVSGEAPIASSTSRARTRGYSLSRCIQLAQGNYASVAEAQARIAQAKAQLRQARTAPFSDFSSTAGVALAPTVRGTNVFSPNTDVALTSDMALAWQVGVSGTIPLWTFGKITNLVDAAEAQVRLKRHETQQVRNELTLSVRRAYYGVLFAREALGLVREAAAQIDKHLGSLQRAVDEDDADEVPLFKMKMNRAELEARISEGQRQEAIALSGLRLLVGVGSLELDEQSLPAPTHQLAPLASYLSAARLHRPEINMARVGVMAREAQVRMERARYFPDLGVTLSGGWSQAPEVTDQVNPFVRDPGNYLRYGVAVGLKWDLDFLPQSARVAEAQAKLDEIRATEQFALGGIAVEVEKAFLEARDAKQRLQAYRQAAKYARRWLITVQQGIDIGVYEDADVVAPAKEYALKRFSEIGATFDYQMALARLALATGWDAVAPLQ